jgi:hypothetical protein
VINSADPDLWHKICDRKMLDLIIRKFSLRIILRMKLLGISQIALMSIKLQISPLFHVDCNNCYNWRDQPKGQGPTDVYWNLEEDKTLAETLYRTMARQYSQHKGNNNGVQKRTVVKIHRHWVTEFAVWCGQMFCKTCHCILHLVPQLSVRNLSCAYKIFHLEA